LSLPLDNRIKTKPVIWIIDSQQWPRAYLRAELIERGFEAVGFAELADGLMALHDPHSVKPQITVLELFGLSFRRDELEALLTRTGIPVIVLGGATELNEPLIREFKWAAAIRRPFSIGKVADVVGELFRRPKEKNNI
jgi:hypothetical protein